MRGLQTYRLLALEYTPCSNHVYSFCHCLVYCHIKSFTKWFCLQRYVCLIIMRSSDKKKKKLFLMKVNIRERIFRCCLSPIRHYFILHLASSRCLYCSYTSQSVKPTWHRETICPNNMWLVLLPPTASTDPPLCCSYETEPSPSLLNPFCT